MGFLFKFLVDFGKGLIMDFWHDYQQEKLRAEAHRASQLEKSLQSVKEAADIARADHARLGARLAEVEVKDDPWNAGG